MTYTWCHLHEDLWLSDIYDFYGLWRALHGYICRGTKVNDILSLGISKFIWQCGGYLAEPTTVENKVSRMVTTNRMNLGSLGRPHTRWTDSFLGVAGSRLVEKAQDRLAVVAVFGEGLYSSGWWSWWFSETYTGFVWYRALKMCVD